jgi:hypothetical protein
MKAHRLWLKYNYDTDVVWSMANNDYLRIDANLLIFKGSIYNRTGFGAKIILIIITHVVVWQTKIIC